MTRITVGNANYVTLKLIRELYNAIPERNPCKMSPASRSCLGVASGSDPASFLPFCLSGSRTTQSRALFHAPHRILLPSLRNFKEASPCARNKSLHKHVLDDSPSQTVSFSDIANLTPINFFNFSFFPNFHLLCNFSCPIFISFIITETKFKKIWMKTK